MKAGHKFGGVLKRLKNSHVLYIVEVDEAAEGAFYIEGGDIFGQGAGIKADEDIRGDPAAAEYGPFFFAQGLIGVCSVVDVRITVEDLSIMEALHDLFVVVVMSFVIGLLDAASRGGIVAGDRQPQGGSIAQLVLFLDQALAEGPSADDGSPVPILKGAGQYFASGGGSFVGQERQAAFFEEAFP